MLAFVAVLLAGLLGMAALTIDLGHATMQQQRLESFADASSMVALRKEALLRFNLARDALQLGRLGCVDADTSAAREACIENWVQSPTQVEAVYKEVLPDESDRGQGLDGAQVALGPRGPEFRRLSCGPFCWRTEASQRIPLLFGQGSSLRFNEGSFGAMMDARARGQVLVEDDGQRPASLRTQGIRIKADTRAETRPVVRVGSPVSGPLNQNAAEPLQAASALRLDAVPGRAAFALELEAWRRAGGGGRLVLIENGTGSLAQGGEEQAPGRRLMNGEALRAGLLLTGDGEDEAWTPLQDAEGAYIPLFVPVSETGEELELVVGFGLAKVDWSEGLQTLTVTRLESQLAPANATASPRLWVRGQAGITQRIEQVLASRGNLGDFLQTPVLQ
ncbi:MAG: hypothetical protein CBC48_16430 [bacterium TMED88]|nr:hypothetical protein [Deltaproteobacteria bacterium]OUV25442.1 MAG: hypothetical protein CBC48_16430 [bacterium TMED88]